MRVTSSRGKITHNDFLFFFFFVFFVTERVEVPTWGRGDAG